MNITLVNIDALILVQCESNSNSIEYVAAALLSKLKAYVSLVEGVDTTSDSVLAKTILSHGPDYVGIATGFHRMSRIESLARAILELDPKIVLFAGGFGVGLYGQELLKSGLFRFLIFGEGETPVFRALTSLENHSSLAGIPGVMSQEQPQTTVWEEDLSRLVSPWLLGLMRPRKYIPWEIGRGCVGRCSYCSGASMSRVRSYSMERIEKELDYIVANFPMVQTIRPLDATINHDHNRMENLLKLFNAKAPNVTWELSAKPNLMTDSLIEQMSKTNVSVELGIQSLNPIALRLAHRPPIDKQRYAELFRKLQEAKVNYNVDVIIGLPGETPQSYREGIEYLLSTGTTNIIYFRLAIYPGTELHRDAVKHGLKCYFPGSKRDGLPEEVEEIREYAKVYGDAYMCDYQVYETPTFTNRDLINAAAWTKNLIGKAHPYNIKDRVHGYTL
jgi:radical SAM superfamily enzyme YgiQ (UPF0313 family)